MTSYASTIFSRERAATSHVYLDERGFELLRHDVTFPLYVEVDEIYQSRLPRVARYTTSSIRCRRPRPVSLASLTAGLAKRVKAPRFFRLRPRRFTAIPSVHPQPEEYWGNVNPIGFRSCYDEGKRCAETLVLRLYSPT